MMPMVMFQKAISPKTAEPPKASTRSKAVPVMSSATGNVTSIGCTGWPSSLTRLSIAISHRRFSPPDLRRQRAGRFNWQRRTHCPARQTPQLPPKGRTRKSAAGAPAAPCRRVPAAPRARRRPAVLLIAFATVLLDGHPRPAPATKTAAPPPPHTQEYDVSQPIPANQKSTGVAYLLWLFLGGLGVHQFYLGKTGRGLLYLFTFGGLLIGVLIDLFTLPAQVRQVNAELAVGTR